jgi:DNA-binding response OmpR family regulator
MRVLIDVTNGRVKDELVEALVRAGHVVDKGSASVSGPRFDVIVVGSIELAERLHRERPAQAVIVFTRVGDVETRIRALEVGAADAVDGSFAHSQVAARVGAAGRRAALIPKPPEQVEIDGCTIDLAASTAERDGLTVELTRKELELVRWLSRHAGRVVTRGELLEHVWQVSTNSSSRAVDVAIAGLRAKIERDASAPVIVVSVKSTGYRWG